MVECPPPKRTMGVRFPPGPFYMTKERVGQVEVILFKKNKGFIEFLLLKRTKERGGFWQPVTGGIEDGEAIEEAAKREVFEETHIKIKELITDVYKFELKNKDGTKYPEYVFGAEINHKVDTTKNIYTEHEEVGFFEYEEAMAKLKWPGNKEGLTNLYKILKTKYNLK